MSLTPPLPAPAPQAVTLASLASLFGRRWQMLFWPALAGLLAAAAWCSLATPRYHATAEIQVQKMDGGAFGLENGVTGPAAAAAATDSLDYTMTLQTKAAVLRSPALAVAVIREAGLEPTEEYFAPAARGHEPPFWHAWLARLPWRKPLEPLSVPLAQAPNRRYAAERIFKAHLKVQPLAGTRLIDVTYTDPDPARAAAVANAAVRVLAALNFEQRFTSTRQGSDWLAGQLEELRARAEQTEAHAVALQRGTGMFGNDASRNVVLERLDSLNQTLTAAESNRILKESIDRVAAGGSPELISSLSGNSSTGSVASVNSSLSLVQSLRQQEAQVRAELAESQVRYGSAYPRVAELQAQLDGVSNALAAETDRLGRRAHTDWQVAAQAETAARDAFEKQKQLASEQNSSVLAYQLAREEADSARSLYEGLLAKLKQARLLEGLRAGDVSIVSQAEEPPPNRPASPNWPLWLGAATLAGLAAGLGAATLAELTSSVLRTPAQVEACTGAPLLAVLPERKARARLPWRKRLEADAWLQEPPPKNGASVPFFESVRGVRTSVQSAGPVGGSRLVLVTSCLPGEGKTTLAKNLALAFAQTGGRVLLIDADLRRPSLFRLGGGARREGLASALSGSGAVPWEQPYQDWPNLHLLGGSEQPPLPSEMLASPAMGTLLDRCRAEHDIIILDAPPVLPVTDAVLLAGHCDAILLLARHNRTAPQALQRSLYTLRQGAEPHPPVGVILNGLASNSGAYRDYFGYDGGAYAAQNA